MFMGIVDQVSVKTKTSASRNADWGSTKTEVAGVSQFH